MRFVFLLCSFLFFMSAASAQPGNSPYAGEEDRGIKALSQVEIQGFLEGRGMGFAMAAELNHYPGPKHVLELSSELILTEEQKIRTQTVFDEMQARAMELGKRIVAEEKALNGLFAVEKIREDALRESTLKIGSLTGSLRAEHLYAHLKMKEILSAEQILEYDKLRGYGSGDMQESHKMKNHHHQ